MKQLFAIAVFALVGACAQFGGARQSQEFLPDGGPPVVNGFYEERDRFPCSSESCSYVRAFMPAFSLRERPYPDAAAVADIAEREWFRRVGAIYRMRPIRGVVQQVIEIDQMTGDGAVLRLEPGDVIYIVDTRTVSDDPGVTIWFRGAAYYFVSDESDAIVWETRTREQADADAAAGEGWWQEVRRVNGQRGFALAGQVGCFGDDKDHSGYCEDGTNPGRRPPDCPAHDVSQECQDLRSSAEPSTRSYRRPRPFRDCDECPSMVWIPRQAFAVSQYEVTFAQWDACVNAGGCTRYMAADLGWGRGDRPVINVYWDDAQDYVQWLSARTGHRYRLLTTEEWTTAAFPGGRRQNYYWGNEPPVCEPGARNGAAYAYCPSQGTWPVGSFQPNAFGLYDMLGNVREWLEDPYYQWGAGRTVIGSSWASPDALGAREEGGELEYSANIGIRVARER
jgi:hypothetical protein